MSNSKLSLLGLYKFDNTLFAQMALPDGIDKTTLINNILLQSADFELLYADLDFMKDAIGMWSSKWNRTFKKWVEALAIEYAPLENYDRQEDWTDDRTNAGTSSGTNTNGGTDTTNRSAFDSSTFQPYEQEVIDNTSSINTSSSNNDNSVHSGRMHGNIGVTTSQQMLQAELDIAEWNLYKHITDIFIQEFCILVY